MGIAKQTAAPREYLINEKPLREIFKVSEFHCFIAQLNLLLQSSSLCAFSIHSTTEFLLLEHSFAKRRAAVSIEERKKRLTWSSYPRKIIHDDDESNFFPLTVRNCIPIKRIGSINIGLRLRLLFNY